ncbi:MAG: hypothetical protein JJV99_02410 [Colwellia sp.]|nr:hypothetical protein [Colwellia sp.]
MLLRLILLVCLFFSFTTNVFAARCLDVFPSGWRSLTPVDEQLINFPINSSSINLTSDTTLPRGDNLYLNSSLTNKGEIFVGPATALDTTARLFVRTAVSWQNVKINKNGNPEDLIIVIDGSLQITGGDTVINAIIYVKGAITINGNPTIKGSIAAVGSGDNNNNNTEVTYNAEYITNADFNGMCDNSPVPKPDPIVNYRFDECTYTGNGFEIIDETGNFNAAIKGVYNSSSNAVINQSLDLSFTEKTDWVQVPKGVVNGLDDFTLSVWINTAVSKPQQEIFQALGSNVDDNELEIYLRNSNDVIINIQDGVLSSLQGTSFRSGIKLTDGEWHHLVISRQLTASQLLAALNPLAALQANNQVCLFVDGIKQKCESKSTLLALLGLLGSKTLSVSNDNAVVLGQEQDSYGGNFSAEQSFEGELDEFKIFSLKLSDSNISNIYDNEKSAKNYDGNTREAVNCTDSFVDHFEINLIDGQGLTCEADNITIKACADKSCTTLNTDATDVVLSVNSLNSLNNTHQTVTVLEGSANTRINHTTAGVATLSLDQTYECINGNPNNCDVTFADAGFRFLYGVAEAESTTIANQISGNNFADIVKLQAVKNVNGVCTGLFTGDIEVELSQQNIAPTGTTGLAFKVNGNTGTNIAKYPTYTSNITLNFAADSKAIIPTPVYLDAGQISLHANYNVGGVSLMGSSNSFWVSPFKLIVTAKSDGVDINGSSSTSETIHKAGQPFDFTVMAVNSLVLSNDNSTDNVTQNYQPNNNDIELLLTRTGPSTNGFDGSFNYGNGAILSALGIANPTYQSTTLTAFNAGISTTNSASYSEVGLLYLDLRDVDYGFLGNTIEGDAIDIGRFTPDYFEQTVVEQGELDSVCNQSTTFAYIGQTLMSDESKGAISYLVNPVVELTAKNAQGNITKNYTESGYTKLEAAANFIKAPTVDSTIKAKDDSYLLLTASVEAGIVSRYGLVAGQPEFGISLDDGILHYELSDDDNFVYIRNENSEINAQDNDIDFVIDQINFVDTDGVAIVTPVDITGTIGIKLRFGRTYLENSFGPETSDLPIPMYTQYLANNNFVTNDLDSCTNYDMSKVTLTPSSVPAINTTVKVVPVSKLDNGATRDLILNASGAGNQGTVNVEYDTSPWLKYDWDWDGVEAKALNQAPTAVATFGLFRGNDRIIYQREIHN